MQEVSWNIWSLLFGHGKDKGVFVDSLSNIRYNIQNLVTFIKENLNKLPTQVIQAEFEILYDQYDKAVEKAVADGATITETKLIMKNEFLVEDELMDQFEEWFYDRLDLFMRKKLSGNSSTIN